MAHSIDLTPSAGALDRMARMFGEELLATVPACDDPRDERKRRLALLRALLDIALCAGTGCDTRADVDAALDRLLPGGGGK